MLNFGIWLVRFYVIMNNKELKCNLNHKIKKTSKIQQMKKVERKKIKNK